MGNSRGSLGGPCPYSVHPHVHGELEVAEAEGKTDYGSSPRAWGTRRLIPTPAAGMRFIPTCMGNSAGIRAGLSRPAVHPHVHGELAITGTAPDTTGGSSPRAWGTLLYAGPPAPGSRFIPTCMGNSLEFLYGTWKTTSWIPCWREHPTGDYWE